MYNNICIRLYCKYGRDKALIEKLYYKTTEPWIAIEQFNTIYCQYNYQWRIKNYKQSKYPKYLIAYCEVSDFYATIELPN